MPKKDLKVQPTSESGNAAKLPVMCRPFDSYFDNGRIIICTKGYSELHSDFVVTEHHITVSRAKEIIADLQDAVRRACT